jgi:hypothetical protein
MEVSGQLTGHFIGGGGRLSGLKTTGDNSLVFAMNRTNIVTTLIELSQLISEDAKL